MNEDKAYFLPRSFDGVDLLDLSEAFKGEKFWIAFRVKAANSEMPPIYLLLKDRGFAPVNTDEILAGGERALFVKMSRVPKGAN
jgi:hypothetical protein